MSEGTQGILGQADNWRSTLVYGLAHLGKSLFWYSSEILFAYFLTEIAGLSSAQMGTVIALGFVISAGIDPVVGHGLRRWLTDATVATRFQLLGAILCSAALVAVFAGAWIPVGFRFAYAVGAGILFRLAFAIYDIPQNALMALATIDSNSRLRIASTRIWFSGAATLLVATMVGPLVAMPDRGHSAIFLVGLVALFALAAIGSAWLLARVMGRPAAAAPRAEAAALPRLRFPLEFWLLIVVMVATSAFTQAFAKLEPYFAAYALRTPWWGGAIIVLMAVGIVVGQPVWMVLCARIGRGAVMLLNAMLQIAALIAFWLLGADCPPASAVAAFLFGIGNGGVGMVQWAAFSEVVARLGPERTGLSYGLFAATGKLSLAAGGMLLASSLAEIDFRGADRLDLIALMAVIPGVGAVACAIVAIGLMAIQRRERMVTV